MSLHNAKEYRSMSAQDKCHKICLNGPFGIFCLYVILTISYLRAQTIETSSLPTDSSRPLFKQIEIFSILTVRLYISTVSTLLNKHASYYSASSGFRAKSPWGKYAVSVFRRFSTQYCGIRHLPMSLSR